MNQQIPHNVLIAFFEGRSTPLESKLIEEWLSVPENEEQFYQHLDKWESQHPQYRPNSELALEKHWELIAVESFPQPVGEAVPRRNKFRYWWPIAASLVLIMVTAAFLLRKLIVYQSYSTNYGQTQSVLLSEGTRVTLNANSTLWVPRWGFGSGQRQVLLEGEAEFKVAHTFDHQHFLVKTASDFEVEVLGTEFVVYTRQHGSHVLLNQGKVQVNYGSGRKMYLKPGELLQLGANAQAKIPQVTRVKRPQQYTAWKQHQFYFDNTPLSEVVVLIREQFGVNIVIADSVTADRRIAGVFKADNANELLTAITTLLDLQIVNKDNFLSLQVTNSN
jgi:ferric-dicitrate binding protein FerR (iron transport regulator)